MRFVVIVAAKLFCRNHGPEQVTPRWGRWQVLLKRLKRRNPFRPVRAPRGALDVAFALRVPPKQQAPHTQDEIYIIVRRGALTHDGKRDGTVGADPEPQGQDGVSGPAIRALILIIVGFLGDPQQHTGLTRGTTKLRGHIAGHRLAGLLPCRLAFTH